MRDGGLWRSRWAAIGAAVAVSLGGGGAFYAQAQTSEGAQSTLAQHIETRQNSGSSSAGTDKARPYVADDGSESATLETDAAALTAGATFTPITPYRTYDSRLYSDGLMIWGDEIYFDVTTDVNGKPKIPTTAVAVTYNLTITGTYGGGGYLALFPPPGQWPGNSSINWFAGGLDLANGGVVAIGTQDAPGQIIVRAGDVPDTATDFILDITGYYA